MANIRRLLAPFTLVLIFGSARAAEDQVMVRVHWNPLLAEEQVVLANLVAAFLKANANGRWTVVEPSEVQRFEATVRDGRDPSSGLSCAVKRDALTAVYDHYRSAGVARLMIGCDDGDQESCRWSLTVSGPGDTRPQVELARFRTEAPLSFDPSVWATTVARLEAVDEPKPAAGGGGVEGGLMAGVLGQDTNSNVHRVGVSEVQAVGEWNEAPTNVGLATLDAELDRCWVPHSSGKPPSILLDVSPNGTITHCEDRSESNFVDVACTCEVFRDHPFPAVPAGIRRLDVRLRSDFPARTVNDEKLQVKMKRPDGDHSYGLVWDAAAAKTCLATTRVPAIATVPVQFTVRPDGTVEDMAVGSSNAPKAVAVCIESALQSAAFTCTSSGQTEQRQVEVEVRKQ